jgi:2-polyprenyl-3-methyl-5-hydroxy-6-metoxy-1,4-benzoquinol methylase
MLIKSPITQSNSVKLIREIPVSIVLAQYKQTYKIDVSRFFKDLDKISVYQCLDTGYCFYYPLNLEGDGAFYAEFFKIHEDYYPAWKWEHAQADTWIKPQQKLLELGCGNGHFLGKIKDKGVNVVGLELNPQAVEDCKQRGLDVRLESIQHFALENKNAFDVVCSFQVLEHIAEVRSFMEASVACLRKDGILIVGVPNNETYTLKNNPHYTPNLPPHHVGLWGAESLSNIQNLFGLKVEQIYKQPKTIGEIKESYRILLRKNVPAWLFRPIHAPTKHLITNLFKNRLPADFGHTIVAVYRKIYQDLYDLQDFQD